MIFVCPKCMGKLNISGGSAVCDAGHSYDRSKHGYFNLLLSSSGGTHGDNALMVEARRAFLDGGYYEPLANAIADEARAYAGEGAVMLDAGCGEGDYTERVARTFAEYPSTRAAAFDISKDAAKRAAKRMPLCEVAVAGSYHMPVADSSIDLIINTFSPLALDEMRRALRSGGGFIMAIPGEDHLFGLKSAIYDTPYKNKVEDTRLEGFRLVSQKELKYTIKLNTDADIRALFMMTPYAYRTGAEGRERVLSLSELETEAHFIILTYEKE